MTRQPRMITDPDVPPPTIEDNEPPTWTAVGYWDNDEIFVTGVVPGQHDVIGGYTCGGDGGPWADSFHANDANHAIDKAERVAVRATLEEAGDADEPIGHEDWQGLDVHDAEQALDRAVDTGTEDDVRAAYKALRTAERAEGCSYPCVHCGEVE